MPRVQEGKPFERDLENNAGGQQTNALRDSRFVNCVRLKNYDVLNHHNQANVSKTSIKTPG